MNVVHIYRAALLVSATFFVMYWFAPWVYGTLPPDRQELLSQNGAGAWFEFPLWFSWAFFVAIMAGYLGMFLFRKLGLWLFLGAVTVNLFLTVSAGISVITPVEVFVVDTSTLLTGFVVALALFSPVRERFY